MKQCPVCRTTYPDDSLSFCLADGTSLSAMSNEEKTVVMSSNEEEATVVRAANQNPLRVNIQDDTPAPAHIPPAVSPSQPSTNWIKILLVILLAGFLVTAVAGIAGLVFYYNSGNASNKDSKSPTPGVSPSPTTDDEKQRLQDELANLQKRLEDQKKANANTQPPNQTSTVTARVNSPRDGFLALRSEPDSEYGERLTRIPHGATIGIGACQNFYVTLGGRRGRWCRVDYGGYSGWVFDAWLSY